MCILGYKLLIRYPMRNANLFKNLFLVLLLLPFGILQSSAQEYISKDIPVIELSFFKGAVPENSDFASTTFIDYSYKFAIERSTRTNRVKVSLTMSVVPNSEKSFFDVSRVNKADIARLVDHEQGHIVIGFIIGKKVEDALNAVSYTAIIKKRSARIMKSFTPGLRRFSWSMIKKPGMGQIWRRKKGGMKRSACCRKRYSIVPQIR
ncbi:MAG TPA: hypothetical protein VK541_20460 [Pedobacter sp.]|uniref:hypothetical protein n=1 Tax=Pedobacter sp. TaxID=1411316 RepID=UPI002CEAE555|nr:hypothetical protein [Pedobacter sp.]HMI04873.1 hypothetical protein [Pedobacter sp.]